MNEEAIHRRLLSLARYLPDGEEPETWARRVREWCRSRLVSLLLPEVPEFFRLREIADPPRLLFVAGDPACLALDSVAVVGSRRPSSYGLRAALCFSRALAERGYSVVSGLARGIDAAAHRAALSANGRTTAVLAHGMDRVYPSANSGLAQEIVSRGGCLVSEYPPGVPPLRHHFPARNRLVSALSLGVVVVEAKPRSGSLITARCALDQNREVFVVPGAFDDAGYEGSHRLIQQGAKLVTSLGDLEEEFPHRSKTTSSTGTEWLGLRDLFRRHDGELRLSDVDGDEVVLLLPRLEEGKRLGKICEIYPQHFVWVGS